MNLGSPESTSVKDVRRYLNEFLMDERVIDVPLFWRTVLVKGIIVPFRAPKSAEKYKTIWTSEGSPLVSHTKKQCGLLQQRVDSPVYYSMRYGSPATAGVLEQIHAENPGLEKIILFPLYPHYAMPTGCGPEHHRERSTQGGRHEARGIKGRPSRWGGRRPRIRMGGARRWDRLRGGSRHRSPPPS